MKDVAWLRIQPSVFQKLWGGFTKAWEFPQNTSKYGEKEIELVLLSYSSFDEQWKRTKGEKWVKQKGMQSPEELPSVNGIES